MENKNMIHESIEMCKIEELELKLSHVTEQLDGISAEYEILENLKKALNDAYDVLFPHVEDINGGSEYKALSDMVDDNMESRSNAISKFNKEYYDISCELNPMIDKMYREQA
jgi:predicted nuclease with TOPRIM domain